MNSFFKLSANEVLQAFFALFWRLCKELIKDSGGKYELISFLCKNYFIDIDSNNKRNFYNGHF